MVLETASRFYLGLPKDVYFVVKLIEGLRPIRSLDILITLKKIRLNDPYFRLGMDFGLAPSTIANVFRKFVKVLAEVFSQLIVWSPSNVNHKFLPIPFRKRYSKVNSIIDCFEITIEKPSNPEHQSFTHGQTIKMQIQ